MSGLTRPIAIVEHRSNFIHRLLELAQRPIINVIFNYFIADQLCRSLITTKHDGWQVVGLVEKIAHTRFRTNRNTGIFQRSDITVDGSFRHIKKLGQILSTNHLSRLQM